MSDFIASLPDHAQTYLDGRRLDEVECIVADLSGIARGKAMPAAKFAKQSHFYLPASIFQQTITGDVVPCFIKSLYFECILRQEAVPVIQ